MDAPDGRLRQVQRTPLDQMLYPPALVAVPAIPDVDLRFEDRMMQGGAIRRMKEKDEFDRKDV